MSDPTMSDAEHAAAVRAAAETFNDCIARAWSAGLYVHCELVRMNMYAGKSRSDVPIIHASLSRPL